MRFVFTWDATSSISRAARTAISPAFASSRSSTVAKHTRASSTATLRCVASTSSASLIARSRTSYSMRSAWMNRMRMGRPPSLTRYKYRRTRGSSVRFLVTGATGFVGGRLVRALVAAGHDVTAVVRDPGKAADLAGIGVTVRKGDVTDKESMRAPMTGVDGLFHVAGWYKIGGRNRSQGRAVNVEGTRNVLELMRELGVPKGVYTSTLAVFGDTRGKVVDETFRPDRRYITEYDRTKAAAHFEVAEPLMRTGLPLVVVQSGVIYGPGDTSQLRDAVHRYLRRKLPAVPRDAAYCWERLPRRFSIRGYCQDSERRLIRTPDVH